MNYYTYAYLREDRTPYYIGKGKDRRAYVRSKDRAIKPPLDKSRIIFLKQRLAEEESFKHEKYMIAIFGRKDLGTGILHNKTDGGEGVSGHIHSKETRRKISEGHKNPSEETRRKISEGNKGKTLSAETRKKISEAKKGKPLSEENRKNLSKVRKGENNPNYGKRGENSIWYNRKHSEETKRKMSEVHKGENNSNYGTKWWNDGCGNSKRCIECPGDGWVLGMK
jgi:hypothetical protein